MYSLYDNRTKKILKRYEIIFDSLFSNNLTDINFYDHIQIKEDFIKFEQKFLRACFLKLYDDIYIDNLLKSHIHFKKIWDKERFFLFNSTRSI